GRIVPKQELLDRVWPETTVTDHSLTEAVRALRNAIGDASQSPKYVQTVHRRGYRFIAEVEQTGAAGGTGRAVNSADERPSGSASARFEWPGRHAVARIAELIVVTTMLVAGLIAISSGPTAPPESESALTLTLPQAAPMRISQNLLNFAISADGRSVLYAGSEPHKLYVRRLVPPQFEPLQGTDLARGATFSPGADEIAYLQWDPNNDEGGITPYRLIKRSLDDGREVQLATGIGRTTGITWGPDGAIAWATETEPGLWLLRPGNSQPILIADQSAQYYVWPQFLPDGEHVIATARNCLGADCPQGGGEAAIVWISTATGEQGVILQGDGRARFVDGGYLVVGRNEQLFAAPFDHAAMRLTGELVAVLQGIMRARLRPVRGTHEAVYFDVSPTGNLLWVQGDAGLPVGDLQLVDRTGVRTRLPVRLGSPAVSPDGKHVVGVSEGEDGGDLFTHEIGSGTARKRLTRGRLISTPIWSPEGNRVTFADRTTGNRDIYTMPINGISGPEQIHDSNFDVTPESWSADGTYLAFTEQHPVTLEDIWLLPPTGGPVPFLRTPFIESGAALSPDGKWIAYHSNQSGEFEIYVRPAPEEFDDIDPTGVGYVQQISTECAGWPVWSRTGSELFYRSCGFPDSFFVVPIDSDTGTRAASPALLFRGDFARARPGPTFSVTPSDGFLLVDTSAAVREFWVWQSWTAELQRLISPGG
ncbi:MAG: winged helix-turn-helix domain-containing protein, partial [Acidobacteriota bacterium]